jgi:hypothetical protein
MCDDYSRSYDPSSCRSISVTCREVHLSRLRDLLWTPRSAVAVEICSHEEAGDIERHRLDFVATALRGVARLSREPSDRQRLWKAARDVLERLMADGWRVHAGVVPEATAIALLKDQAPDIAVAVSWEEDPVLRACNSVDDWLNSYALPPLRLSGKAN